MTTNSIAPTLVVRSHGLLQQPVDQRLQLRRRDEWRRPIRLRTSRRRRSDHRPDASPRQTLLVWGRVERGQLVLEPAFSLVARPSVPRETGPYRVEGIARNGRTLFSYSFAGDRPADADDATARHFAFAIPMDEATQSELGVHSPVPAAAALAGDDAGLTRPDGVSAAVNTHRGDRSARRAASAYTGAPRGRAWRSFAIVARQVLSFARGGSARVHVRRRRISR